ncbi:hypothetical protein JG688_00010557 [Phytophthora aleatoria]|uniref:Uncharacterized protein n=1 Tax=Phytophthora aleatoria TaxID=2496075 RepID=A0A8J5M393_9STRA|nr:hypothetical protein JG688_00010557 [Phytophthora aleatoria]
MPFVVTRRDDQHDQATNTQAHAFQDFQRQQAASRAGMPVLLSTRPAHDPVRRASWRRDDSLASPR